MFTHRPTSTLTPVSSGFQGTYTSSSSNNNVQEDAHGHTAKTKLNIQNIQKLTAYT